MSLRRLARTTRTVVAALTIAGTAATTLGVGSAGAINPNQTTFSGVVNVLGGSSAGSIANFWRLNFAGWRLGYRAPRLAYYDTPASPGPVRTACGVLSVNNSFWCPSDGTIYLDYRWNQSLINRTGDYNAGGVLAHEWGHAIATNLRWASRDYRDEYFADCLAGMYTRYGYGTGRLVGTDYAEMAQWYLSQPSSVSHGTGTQRAAWYRYGYQTYNINNCALVWGSGRSVPRVAQDPTIAQSLVG